MEEVKLKKPKQERTTPEELNFFVEFCKANPVMTTGRNNPRAPFALQKLWEDLAGSLNAMRGPSRNALQWKESLGHWKNMVRSRARQGVAEAKATGGGPRTTSVLSDLELRAVSVFGTAAVSGRVGVQAMGFRSIAQDELSQSSPEQTQSPQSECTRSPLLMSESQLSENGPSPSIPQSPLSGQEILTEAASRKRQRIDPEVEALELLRESLAKRAEMDERAVAAQLETASAMKEMAAAVLALSQAVAAENNKN